jgi:F420-non-reducing hydrogenase iron-sulfur subunit
MLKKFDPNIMAFLCNWCSYAGADLTGTSHFHYPSNLRVMRVMCTGRINPLLVVSAFRHGADGVLISGCHPGECHYVEGNYLVRRRIRLFRNLLDFVGINPDRLRMSWVSASEGKKFSQVVEEVTKKVTELGPLRTFEEQKV